MGARSVSFGFTPGENEQIETVIKLPEEHRSIIYGVVKDHKCRVVKDAVVKLFEQDNPHDEHCLKPLSHTFTDECGQFVFGPLVAYKHYMIKVWVNSVKIRELVIYPDNCCDGQDKSECHDERHCAESPNSKTNNTEGVENPNMKSECAEENA